MTVVGAAVSEDDRARAITARHDRGLLTAHERIAVLYDAHSFVDAAPFIDDGLVTGRGNVGGRPVFAYAQDATVAEGALSAAHAERVCTLLEQAMHAGAPVVALLDTAGTRFEDWICGLAKLGDVQRRQVQARARIPQIALIMGPCAGWVSSVAALADLRIMVEGSASLFLTGPEIVETVVGEATSTAELGGADVHGARSGLADLVYADDVEALLQVRHCLGFLRASCGVAPPVMPTHDPATRDEPSLETLVPRDRSRPYEIRELLGKMADEGDLLELQPDFAANIVTALARLNGSPVGFVANRDSVVAGCLDRDALDKAARFVRLCERFGLPLLTFVDAPGFVPGSAQEHNGIVRHAAQLAAAYAACTVPRITVIVGRAYGGAYGVMAPKALGSDVVLAWPHADVALLGGDRPARSRATAVPCHIDEVIAPAETRSRLCQALAALRAG